MRWLSGLGIFVTVHAYAGSGCTPVDLRAQLGPAMHQGDSGYCFAHSASSLIQARFGIRVSPMQLATAYILTTPDEISGAADERVRAKLTPAFFEMWHHDRTQEPQNYTPAKILTDTGLLNTGGDELQTLVVANYVGLCDESRLPTGRDVYEKYLKSINSFHVRRVKNGQNPDERDRPIGEVTDPDARVKAWSYRLWVERQCGLNSLPPAPLVPNLIKLASNLKAFRRLQRVVGDGVIEGGRNRLMKSIDEQLSRGNPVAIGYALGDLMPDEKTVHAGNPPSAADVDHASVLAGRHEMGGRCYYYLRNSFGQESKGYATQFKGRYENGGVWVLPEEIPSLYSAIWLE
jgi:hypothetical protein